MPKTWIGLLAVLCMAAGAQTKSDRDGNPGCAHQTPLDCLNRAMVAMGGRERLEQVKSVRLQTIGHTLLMEQSYRQDPFIASYETARTTLDIINQRLRSETKLTWPEADQKQSEIESVLVVGREGGVNRAKTGDTPCSIAHLTAAHDVLALG